LNVLLENEPGDTGERKGEAMKAVIGISANHNAAESLYCLKEAYVVSVREAGGVPLILPALDDVALVDEYLDICDAFIFSGGGDIDPFYWGEVPETGLGEINPLRDSFELKLARRLLLQNIPVLGICRGCQLLSVASGGKLVQDLATGMSHEQNAPRYYPFHDILVYKETLLARILDNHEARVNSFHHQAVREAGVGMRVSARAPDGTIEAIESIDKNFWLGVQWHPEFLRDEYSRRLFRTLIEAAYMTK
jgi:putative glutamine amidotransferase